MIQCWDVCEVGRGKGFPEKAMLELNFPEEKIGSTVMKEREEHHSHREVVSKGFNGSMDNYLKRGWRGIKDADYIVPSVFLFPPARLAPSCHSDFSLNVTY